MARIQIMRRNYRKMRAAYLSMLEKLWQPVTNCQPQKLFPPESQAAAAAVKSPDKGRSSASGTSSATRVEKNVESPIHVSKKPLLKKGETQYLENKKPTAGSPPKPSIHNLNPTRFNALHSGPKQQVPEPSSKPLVTQSQVRTKRSSVRAKRPRSLDNEDDDLDYAISEIRKMFEYNPKKYVGNDYDDKNMEANFEDIQREEKISARIAGREDREELRKIRHEERKGRLQKEVKWRKIEKLLV